MRFGFVVPYADAREFADLAALGEQRGWDAVFTWESVWGLHAWVTLGAAAMVTERIRLGTLLTPASRWRPWDLASAVLTVDRLSGGRAVMGVGLGALNGNWTAFEDDEGRRVRAEKLDECLAVYDGLMRGQPFTYNGDAFLGQAGRRARPRPAGPAAEAAGLGHRREGRRPAAAAVAGTGGPVGRPDPDRRRQRGRPGREQPGRARRHRRRGQGAAGGGRARRGALRRDHRRGLKRRVRAAPTPGPRLLGGGGRHLVDRELVEHRAGRGRTGRGPPSHRGRPPR